MSEEKLRGIIDAKTLAVEVGGIVYKQGKAKIFNVLESQIDDPNKLKACKRITEDILTNISRDASEFIIDTLGDLEIDVEVDAAGDLPEKEAAEVSMEYEEIKEILRIHD
jgi:hypothetical protein